MRKRRPRGSSCRRRPRPRGRGPSKERCSNRQTVVRPLNGKKMNKIGPWLFADLKTFEGKKMNRIEPWLFADLNSSLNY